MIIFACCNDDKFQQDRVLVVEGWIDSGDYPIVMITTSLPISGDNHSIESIDDCLLKWAKVTISDGNELVTLTGKVDTCYFPPYIFTTGKMKGEAGKSYKLTVAYEELYAEAETTIPVPVSIDSFHVAPLEDNNYFQVKAYFRDIPNETNYYKLFAKVKGKDNLMLPTLLGTIKDDVIGDSPEAIVYQPARFFGENYSPYFNKGDTIAIKFSHLTSDAYMFWKTFEEMQTFSGVLFFPFSLNLPSNIKGGIGYWFGYGSNTYFLDAPINK